MKTIKHLFILSLIAFTFKLQAQQEKIAVLNIDVKGIDYDEVSMGNLVRLELEKKGLYRVMDKYDISYIMNQEGFDYSDCYGKICLVEAGKILKADKMLTGNIERFDDKIVIIFRMIDVKQSIIEKADIMEYIDAPEIQRMVSISLNNIFGIPNDNNVVDQISNVADPVNSPKTQLKLNGPRMGLSFIGGMNGDILQAPLNEGGFASYPVSTLIGYQKEYSYLSSGNFQALIEIIPMVGGLEQGRFVPSISFLNGIRSNKSGLEIGFGPVFELVKLRKGYYDESNKWHLKSEWDSPENYETTTDDWGEEIQVLPSNPNDIVKRLDSRASVPTLSTAWVWAIGKTFKSGYINIPVNVYFSLKRNGWVVGTSFGFNVSK